MAELKKLSQQMPSGGKSMIYKDKAGQAWFLGIYSNNFEDREKETFTWDSHLDYAKWVKEMGVRLPVTVAHQPKFPPELHIAMLAGLMNGTFTADEFSEKYLKLYSPYAFAQTEAIIPVSGFTLVVAKILTGKEKVVELLSKLNWGMSHGFLTLARSEDTIDQYRSFEFTTLPPEMAANMLTVSSIKENIMDITKGMSNEDQNKLTELLNVDPKELEGKLADVQQILGKVFNSKELTPEEENTDSYEEIRSKIFGDLNVEALQKSFADISTMLQQLNQRLDDVDARLKQAERSEDEKIAQTLTNPFQAMDWSMFKSASEQPENAEELKEKALGDKPVEGVGEKKLTPDVNPLAWSVANIFAQ